MPVIPFEPEMMPARVEMRGINSVVWSTMATGDTGSPACLARNADRSVQVTGTFAGSTVTFQGSLLPTPSTDADWADLRDAMGTTLSMTSAGILEVLQMTVWIRPKVTGGAADSLTVRLTSRTSSP